MKDIDAQISDIKFRRDAAQLASLRAQAARESAQSNYDAALNKLREKFGVDTPQEIRDRLAELQATLQTRLAEVDEILKEINF